MPNATKTLDWFTQSSVPFYERTGVYTKPKPRLSVRLDAPPRQEEPEEDTTGTPEPESDELVSPLPGCLIPTMSEESQILNETQVGLIAK